ncbi:hypothetical protein FRB99_003935 [Tulasnella sp. 403]|nr:hypothetical protein FRB99_003935 [Tulasnella sp. 403]
MSLTPSASAHHIPYSAPGTPAVGHVTIVGFIGVGNMSAHIAKNLATWLATHKHGAYEVLLWNRTKDKAVRVASEIEERLATGGGMIDVQVADSLDEIVEAADIVITSMGSDQALLDVAENIAKVVKEHKPKHRIIVDTSTVYPSTAGSVDRILTADENTHYVASPVFGPPQAARDAKLIICLAGDYASKKKIAYLLCPAAGRKVIDLGGNVEKVLAFKLLGNALIVGNIELLAELHTFAEKVGVGSTAFHEIATELFPSPLVTNYSKRIMEDNFDGSTGFNIDGGLKDVHHIQRLSAEHEAPLPIIDTVQQHLLTARALNASMPSYKQNPNMDWSSLVAANRIAAGIIDPFDSQKHKLGPVPENQ